MKGRAPNFHRHDTYKNRKEDYRWKCAKTKQVRKFEELKRVGEDEDARELQRNINKQLQGTIASLKEIDLPVGVMSGSFSVAPISPLDYEKIMMEQTKIAYRMLEEKPSQSRANVLGTNGSKILEATRS